MVADSCDAGGEEFFEVGGSSDHVGSTNFALLGVTVDAMVVDTDTASEGDCGPEPFTASMQLMTRQQAIDDGYDSSAVVRLPVR